MDSSALIGTQDTGVPTSSGQGPGLTFLVLIHSVVDPKLVPKGPKDASNEDGCSQLSPPPFVTPVLQMTFTCLSYDLHALMGSPSRGCGKLEIITVASVVQVLRPRFVIRRPLEIAIADSRAANSIDGHC